MPVGNYNMPVMPPWQHYIPPHLFLEFKYVGYQGGILNLVGN